LNTIFAQSSAYGKAGVTVFRISGKESLKTIKKLLKSEDAVLTPNFMYHRKIFTPETNELIDHAMIVYFKGPKSFTGEDVVEIHTHGSVAIAKLITASLFSVENLRLAEPGEFARRAFLNDKFDLTAAEGLVDLIEAETILQHRQAISQTQGSLHDLYEGWRAKALTIISLLEAYIDFPDEDIPQSVLDTVTQTVATLTDTINHHLNDNRRGERMRTGLKLAIIGAPNVGKSSLLNFLMQREVAIVSNIPGTTRDVIEGHLDIGGYPVILHDTAGIRQGTTDIIEQEGIKRATRLAKDADIKLILFDANDFDAKSLEAFDSIIDEDTIIIVNKIDQVSQVKLTDINNQQPILISVKAKKNLDELLNEIEKKAAKVAGAVQGPQITRERHRHQLHQALEHLSRFDLEGDLVLATEDIRMTIRSLSQITGKITVDEILGEIFANFCIGK
jgi:tRNA modification GTPase